MGADRWGPFLSRLKACARVQASIDNARAAVQSAQLDVHGQLGAGGSAALEEIRRELLAAEGALFAAQERIRAALAEKAATPANREPSFWADGEARHG